MLLVWQRNVLNPLVNFVEVSIKKIANTIAKNIAIIIPIPGHYFDLILGF